MYVWSQVAGTEAAQEYPQAAWFLLYSIIIVAYTLDWQHFSATEYFRNIKLTSAIYVEYCLLQQVMWTNIILLLQTAKQRKKD